MRTYAAALAVALLAVSWSWAGANSAIAVDATVPTLVPRPSGLRAADLLATLDTSQRETGVRTAALQSASASRIKGNNNVYAPAPEAGAVGGQSSANDLDDSQAEYRPYVTILLRSDAAGRPVNWYRLQSGWELTAATEPTPSDRERGVDRYSGRYSAAVTGGSIVLELQQFDSRHLTGRLLALDGSTFQLEGMIAASGGIEGTARSGQSGLFFAGKLTPTGLQMIFAEPDASGRANPASAKQLQFTRADGMASPGPGPLTSAPPPPSQNHLLRGLYCSYSGSSGPAGSYSRSTRAHFDGKGQFQHSSEGYSSGDSGRYYGRGGSPANRGQYRVQGNQIALSFSDGSSGIAHVYERGRDGVITALQYDRTIYARVLCD